MNSQTRIILVLLAAASLTGARTSAQAFKDEPDVWTLSVRARPVTRPALAHALLVPPSEQIPGNAAPQYLMAMSEAKRIEVPPVDKAALAAKGMPPTDEGDMLYYYLSVPLEKLPVKDVEEFMRPYANALTMLDSATRRETCNWELPIRELGFETLLPYLNDARHLTNVASLRVRLDAARGDYLAAARGLRTIFQMGVHIGQRGLLIQALVGSGLASVGVDRVKDVVQQPGAPNFYWPLANLPRPMFNTAETMQWEAMALMANFPQLQKIPAGKPFTAADWAELVTRQGQINRITANRAAPATSLDSAIGPAAAGAMIYPDAKRFLVARGMTQEQVDALPVPEALGRYVYAEYQAGFDDIAKWGGLPYWQAQPGMTRSQRDLFAPSASLPVRAIAAAVPAVTRAADTLTRLDTRVAALQAVEAIRAHAAAHDGKLPASLDEVNTAGDTPVPLNPYTGQPLGYRVDRGRAVIDVPALPGQPKRMGLRIELTIVK